MIILAIETSCDETAISIVEVTGDFPDATYTILANALWSQIDVHREFGGVFPAVAKREHAAMIIPLLEKVCREANLPTNAYTPSPFPEVEADIRTLLERETGLYDQLTTFLHEHGAPQIDYLAVTSGPGLEPALWVGVNVAKALATLWDVPVIPVNHMEGHVLASIFNCERDDQLSQITFPAISLLISGGHTELILMRNWQQYEKIGQTRDDAVGEAYDKVARLLGLPYPGGKEVDARAKLARQKHLPRYAELPSPMLHANNLDFSFSGLKTAVRYAVAEKTLSEQEVAAVCRDFEDAVTAVLLKKASRAVAEHDATTLIIGGGVSANRHLREQFNAYFLVNHPEVTVYFPAPGLSTDNSIMIALAGHANVARALSPAGARAIRADGNRSLG